MSRIIFFSIFAFQIWQFVNYLNYMKYIKNRENVFYSFNSMCACTDFVTINGTTNNMYDSMSTRTGPTSIYPFVITVKIIGVLIVIMYDWQIYRRIISKKRNSWRCSTYCNYKLDEGTCLTKFTMILCSVFGLLLTANLQAVMTFSGNAGDSSVWFYECLPNYVPVQTTYNTCNSSCAYQVDHYDYGWTTIDVSCVNVSNTITNFIIQQNNSTMSAYYTYFDILELKSLIIKLSIVISISSIHDFLSNGLSQILSLIYSCFMS
jgi:hypothetical protein